MIKAIRAKTLGVATALLLVAGHATAQESGSPVAHKILANGLEVFVVENHSVPLATVCVGFRGGAIGHNEKNAGLFHLYEHMLFVSNEKYSNQAAFMAALNAMGAPNWNGGTGVEGINYFVTVPSAKLIEGIEFWSWAVKSPTFNAEQLENEKKVVINEIRGYHVDPDQYFYDALQSRLFPKYPWRRNIDGPEANIQAATVESMKTLQQEYYIPANTALFIGGDVIAADVFSAVDRFFGDWKGGRSPAIGQPPQPGIAKDVKIILEDPDFYDGIAGANITWRGPDSLRQTADTYAADVLLQLLRSPVGRFKQAINTRVPGIYNVEYLSFNYPTMRDGGLFTVGAVLAVDDPAAEGAILDRVEGLRKEVLAELRTIADNPTAYFSESDIALAKQKLIDDSTYAMEDAHRFVTGSLFFWWSVATADYYLKYEQNCSRVTGKDIQKLIRKYFLQSPSGTDVRMSEAVAKSDAAMEDRKKMLGYETITSQNAFWWGR